MNRTWPDNVTLVVGIPQACIEDGARDRGAFDGRAGMATNLGGDLVHKGYLVVGEHD